jgi:hypothetical protein
MMIDSCQESRPDHVLFTFSEREVWLCAFCSGSFSSFGVGVQYQDQYRVMKSVKSEDATPLFLRNSLMRWVYHQKELIRSAMEKKNRLLKDTMNLPGHKTVEMSLS